MEKYDFIKLMLQNRNLSVNDKKRLLLLATREIERADVSLNPKEREQKKDEGKEDEKKIIPAVHAPKNTAEILSLFNRRDGFKYLTHNYDNSNLCLNEMLIHVKKVFEENKRGKNLPNSLLALLNNFINGKEWWDATGKKYSDGFGNPSWIEWSLKNEGKHPITDIGGMEKTIQHFRHTVRVVAPDLEQIVKRIAEKFPSLLVKLSNLDKADFYTNVFVLRSRLTDIFKDINDHAGQEYKEIHVEYIPDISGEYFLHHIRITQVGSFSTLSIETVIRKYKSSGGGFFYENAEKLKGYCNWSVESLWDGKPFRWNILDDTGAEIIEQIDTKDVIGFSHLLTFYQKD